MPNSIFISYRRLDSQHATFAIADRLSWAFGADEVFFDRGSIRAGHQWPDALERGLNARTTGTQTARRHDHCASSAIRRL